MILFGISPTKHQELITRMSRLNIREAELEEKFIHSSGPGGQNVNKTSTCVYLFHAPSQLEIKCQKTRSQALNRYWARRLLCDKLEQIVLGEKSKEIQKREKIRRQKRKRSKRAKEKMLEGKKHRSDTKKLRKPIKDSD